MDYIAGSFYDGFVLYAMALEETLAEGGAQNDGISITMKMQNRHMWGEQIAEMCSKWCAGEGFETTHGHTCSWPRAKKKGLRGLTATAAWEQFSAVNMQRCQVGHDWKHHWPWNENKAITAPASSHHLPRQLIVYLALAVHTLLLTLWLSCHTSGCRTMGYCFHSNS